MTTWYTDSARSAIRLALETEGLGAGEFADAATGRPPGEALLPAYLCDTLLAPFHERSLAVWFYDVNPDLSVNLEDLARRLGPRTQALLFVHYFGFPQPERVRRFFAGLATPRRGRGAQGFADQGFAEAADQEAVDGTVQRPLVVEDLTHAVWTDGGLGADGDADGGGDGGARHTGHAGVADAAAVGCAGDYTVASYRKFGMPFDGGYLRSNSGREAAAAVSGSPGGALDPDADSPRMASRALPVQLAPWATPAHCLSVLAWSLDRADLSHRTTGDARLGDLARDLWEQVEVEYGRECRPHAMAPGTRQLLSEVDGTALAVRRRAVYAQALAVVSACPHGRPLWPELPEGVVPLVLPIQANTAAERGPMRAWLARRGLQTVLLWPLAPGIDPTEFPGAAEAAARLASVLLPLGDAENRAL